MENGEWKRMNQKIYYDECKVRVTKLAVKKNGQCRVTALSVFHSPLSILHSP
jgi:hypothetical protein